MIDISSPVEFTKHLEQLGDIIASDTHSSVFYVHDNTLVTVVVARFYLDRAIDCKLEGVLD